MNKNTDYHRRLAQVQWEDDHTVRTVISVSTTSNIDHSVSFCVCPGKEPWFEAEYSGDYPSQHGCEIYKLKAAGEPLERVARPAWIQLAKEKGLLPIDSSELSCGKIRQ